MSAPRIVVAGMGPVGMTAALMLARRGLDVTVLEAGHDLATESRASTFHPPSLEILDEIGVLDELMAVGLRAPGFQYRGRDRTLIAHLDMEALGEDTPFPFRVQSEQSNLTRIIRHHLEAMPNVTLRFDAPVERVEEGTDCAHVYLPGDRFEASYRADWLVAADGASSAARRSMGIAFEGVTYPERFLVASTTHDFAEDFADLAHVSYVYDPEDWGVLLRTPQHWRVLFPVDPDETDDQALEAARVEERLQGVVRLDEPYPVVHSTIYAVHQRLAATFGRGRVLLAGDAAHINNPLGGMGMNSGLHDAEAAAHAVLYAVEGGDPVRAVESYAKVRRDAAAIDVQQRTQRNYEEMRDRDAASRSDRSEQMARIAADPETARIYLRGTSMLASRELSRQRMRRALTPVRPPAALHGGTRLSDLIREGRLLRSGRDLEYVDARAGSGGGADLGVPGSLDELPHIVVTDEVSAIGDTVRELDVHGVAALEIVTADLDVRAAACAQAVSARRDLIVLATLDCGGEVDVDALVAAARSLEDAGADLIGVTGTQDLSVVGEIHRAASRLPVALIGGDEPTRATDDQLSLAGVRLLLRRARA